MLPAAIIGSGLGKNNAWRGDFDIQLFDPTIRRRHGLGSLRFGDLVAIINSDAQYGAAWHGGRVTIGVVVHGDEHDRWDTGPARDAAADGSRHRACARSVTKPQISRSIQSSRVHSTPLDARTCRTRINILQKDETKIA